MKIKKLGVIGAAFIMLASAFTVDAVAGKTITQNEIGSIGNYDYEFWTDVQPGASGNKAAMTLKEWVVHLLPNTIPLATKTLLCV